jgi:hypothetical protein
LHVAHAGDVVHRGGAVEEAVDVEPLEGHGHEPDGGGDAGAAADPVPHREALQPVFLLGLLVELRAFAGDGHGVTGEVQGLFLERVAGFEHAVARLGRSAGLGDHQHEGALEAVFQPGEEALNAVGIGVVHEVEAQPIALGAKGLGDQLGAEG